MSYIGRIDHPSNQFFAYATETIHNFNNLKREFPEYTEDQLIALMNITAKAIKEDGFWEFVKIFDDIRLDIDTISCTLEDLLNKLENPKE